jgi:NAD(P)-dependent dehydrogenase (short-subunit alcohol dehydrogenase family)
VPTPQDAAELVAFLCSERAARISGAVIPVVGRKEV